VFNRIDRAMKGFYQGKRSEALAEGLPPGAMVKASHWVTSGPFITPGATNPLIIRGLPDLLIDCDDGRTGVVDLKTSEPGSSNLCGYSRQLHAYAWALEHPARGRPVVVSTLGLLCFSPDAYEAHGSRAALLGDLRWLEVERDGQGFEAFLTEVAAVVERPEPPPAAADCPWCAWRGVEPSHAAA
jgi:hypothetical protein